MPSRVIRGEINASRSLAKVSLQADLAFRALLVAVDDFGRAEADPLMLKAALFPRRPEVSPDQVYAWVEELAVEGCVRLYVVDGVEYLYLTGWEKHRSNGRRASSSKHPEPSEDCIRIPRISEEVRGSPEDASEIRPSGGFKVASGVCRVASSEGRVLPSAVTPEPAAPATPPERGVSPPELPPWQPEPPSGDSPPPEDASRSPPQRSPYEPQISAEDARGVNVLAKLEGDHREKLFWLAEELPQIEADVEAGVGTFRQIAIRYYRAYLRRGKREHREAASLSAARTIAWRQRIELEARGVDPRELD